jgi:carbonic anhydrase
MSAFTKMIEGFLAFQRTVRRVDPGLFDRLAGKQEPKCMVIACCDSRVDPAIITNAAPGELFITRNVANLVPPHEPDARYHGTSAALEFAVYVLKVEFIVVMGHSGCGGIQALIEQSPVLGAYGDYIGSWMRLAEPARLRTLAAVGDQPRERQCAHCEREVVKVSLANLMTFPCIAQRVRTGAITLCGLYFDIQSGAMDRYDPERDVFVPLA